MNKHYDKMTGYKATNSDMTCNGFQFEFDKWHTHKGEIKLCQSGFHFCKYPSGPFSYYRSSLSRIFKVKAKNVIEEYEPGSDLKLVCSKIRLIEELKQTGDQNTGDRNTGDQNTGDRNTGDQNAGDQNTGNWNTGNWNTGYRNTGDRNTGYRNTGDRNTGNWNTGNRNTGSGNATNRSSGFFAQKESCVMSFDKQTKLTYAEFMSSYPNALTLTELLSRDNAFDYTEFKNIPGWELSKCKKLHKAHIAARNKQYEQYRQ